MSKELKSDSLETKLEKRKKKLYKYLKKPLGLTEIFELRNPHEGEWSKGSDTGTAYVSVVEGQVIEMKAKHKNAVQVCFNISLDKLDELLVLLERD